MFHSLRATAAFSAALMLGMFLGASSSASPSHIDSILGGSGPSAQQVSEAAPPPPDPNKKKDGEPCKSADECQKHHTCTKVGDQSVCKAPERPRLPPGATT